MKRVLFFIESLSGGGAEKVLVTYLQYLDKRKYEITLMTLVDTGVYKEFIDPAQLCYSSIIRPSHNKIIDLENKIKYNLLYRYLPTRLASKLVIPRGYDLYVAFTEGFATKLIAYVPGKKMAWVHIDLKSFPWTQEKRIFRSLHEEKLVYTKYNRVVCVSDSVERGMRNLYDLSNTMTLSNPIDAEMIQSLSYADCDIHFNASSFNIITIGRLTRQKGYDLLIPIIARLRKEKIDVNLYIMGDGEQRNSLEQIILDKNLSDSVHLLGYFKNPYPFFSQMDLFVCSSRAEGYSLVMAEALVLGIPVVSMNCAGPRELLDNGLFGCLCDTYEELEAALFRVTADNSYYQFLKQQAISRRSFFDIRKSMAQVEMLFDSL